MKGVYRMAWVETQALFAEVAPVVAALEAAGVDTLMLKGVPLALTVYRTPAARPMRDVDIAVRHPDADRAIAVIEGLGWTLERPMSRDERAYIQAITLRSSRRARTRPALALSLRDDQRPRRRLVLGPCAYLRLSGRRHAPAVA